MYYTLARPFIPENTVNGLFRLLFLLFLFCLCSDVSQYCSYLTCFVLHYFFLHLIPYVLFVSVTQVTRAWCWPETFLRDENIQLLLVFLLQMWAFNGRFHRHFSSWHHSEIISCIWCYNVTIIGQKKALRWSTTPT